MRCYNQQILVIDALQSYRKRRKNRKSFPGFSLGGQIELWDHYPGEDTEQHIFISEVVESVLRLISVQDQHIRVWQLALKPVLLKQSKTSKETNHKMESPSSCYINSELSFKGSSTAGIIWHLCILAFLTFKDPGVLSDLDYHLFFAPQIFSRTIRKIQPHYTEQFYVVFFSSQVNNFIINITMLKLVE